MIAPKISADTNILNLSKYLNNYGDVDIDMDQLAQAIAKATSELGEGYLKYASKELRADKELVMAAIGQRVSSLEYASEELKGDKEVAMAAIKEDPYSIWYISEELKRKVEMVCRFAYVGYELINGNIKSIKNTNVAYVKPHILKVKNSDYLIFEEYDDRDFDI